MWILAYVTLFFTIYDAYTPLNLSAWNSSKISFNVTMRRMVKQSTSNQHILISFYWNLWNEEISEMTIGKYSQITFED